MTVGTEGKTKTEEEIHCKNLTKYFLCLVSNADGICKETLNFT